MDESVIEKLTDYLSLLKLEALTGEEVFLLENSGLDVESPCYVANLLEFLVNYRLKNNICASLDSEMLQSIANKEGCSISVAEPDNSNFNSLVIPINYRC